MEWMVIGAGPAGIAAVGKLIDQGIPPEKIGWMDPHFQVGDLGDKWNRVSSNTKVELFHRFLSCKAFGYDRRPKSFPLDHLDPQQTCELQNIVDPLQWVTDQLKTKVKSFHEFALGLNLINNHWEIKTKNHLHRAKNVILAIGAEPKLLNFPDKKVIPLEAALNFDKLSQLVQPQDTIGVFGASHSAVLILASLNKIQPKSIINFYRSPHLYAIDYGDWILFDNTGLKGYAAEWAKKHLDGALPKNMVRILSSDHTFAEVMAQCDKVIYAVGFQTRELPTLEQFEKLEYNDKTGIIAPGLFGLGIAFPEVQYDKLMNLEVRVGLWKFMDYLNRILPIWLSYSNK